MKTLLISAAAVALAGPVFADPAQYANEHFAEVSEMGDGARRLEETSTGNVAYVIEHFAQSRSGGDGPRILVPGEDDMTVSSSNSDLAAYARAVLDNGLKGDN